MNKVSDVLAGRFIQDPLETYFCKKHPPGAGIDKLRFYLRCQDFSKTKSIQANSSK